MNPTSPKWAERFLELAHIISKWSKDSTKVGCVIVSQDGVILSTGYNGIPRGVEDHPCRLERPEKYLWTAHAEENAITSAARHGAKLHNSVLFCTHLPCSRCAGMIINAGISVVVIDDGMTSMPHTEFVVAREKFHESGINLKIVSKDPT